MKPRSRLDEIELSLARDLFPSTFCNEMQIGRTKNHPFLPIAISDLDVTSRIVAFLIKFLVMFEKDTVLYRYMTSDFTNDRNILGNFVDIIRNLCFNTCSQNECSCPHEVLKASTYVEWRSAGTGKTRLLFELGRKALPVFYVCLSGPFKSSANI